MNYAPIARILIRYGAGVVIGFDTAGIIAGDPDVVTYAAMGIGAAVEYAYVLAVKKGWAT